MFSCEREKEGHRLSILLNKDSCCLKQLLMSSKESHLYSRLSYRVAEMARRVCELHLIWLTRQFVGQMEIILTEATQKR